MAKKKAVRFVCVSGLKKYFVNALALNDHFKGEVELMDNFTHVDYFETYYAHPKKTTFS